MASFKAFCGAVIWVFIAFCIAVPQELGTVFLHHAGSVPKPDAWKNLVKSLFGDLHVYFVFLLIGLDVFIGIRLLNDQKLSNRCKENAFLIISLTALVPLCFLIVYKTKIVDETVFWNLAVVAASVVCVFLRFWTYHYAHGPKPVQTPTFTRN